jgi:hypothetical protein
MACLDLCSPPATFSWLAVGHCFITRRDTCTVPLLTWGFWWETAESCPGLAWACLGQPLWEGTAQHHGLDMGCSTNLFKLAELVTSCASPIMLAHVMNATCAPLPATCFEVSTGAWPHWGKRLAGPTWLLAHGTYCPADLVLWHLRICCGGWPDVAAGTIVTDSVWGWGLAHPLGPIKHGCRRHSAAAAAASGPLRITTTLQPPD